MATRRSDSQEDKEEKVSSRSLINAEKCIQKGNYGRAFAHYLLVLKLTPSKKSEIKENFTLALREWSEQLERSGRVKDLFNCYEQACDLFPECETMLNNMGAQLFRLGYVDEAACFFRRSLKLDPDYLGARENLENICGHLVERWHFRMLNDRVRNEAYRNAIATAIQEGFDTVLDIGTGTGLLSMFAAEAGAKAVYGCDMSKTMYEMSCDVVLTNQMAQKIQLMHSKSTDLQIPEDIPERVSLIVTEIFDVALLGEGVIPALHHAWEHLLKVPQQGCQMARVIPGGATMYICGVESNYIREHNRFLYPGMQHLDFQGINIECKTSHNNVHHSYEPYTSERLDQLPGGGCRVLTQPLAFANFDFNDPKCIEKFLKGFSQDVTLPVCSHGRLDAVAAWFDLHLDPKVTLSTAPGSGSCWEQTLFPVLASQLQQNETHNLLVRKSDKIDLTCTFAADYLTFKCTSIHKSPPAAKLTPSNSSPVINPQPQIPQSLSWPSWQPRTNQRATGGHNPSSSSSSILSFELARFAMAPQSARNLQLRFGDVESLSYLDNHRTALNPTIGGYNLSLYFSSTTEGSDQSSMDDTSSSDELSLPDSGHGSYVGAASSSSRFHASPPPPPVFFHSSPHMHQLSGASSFQTALHHVNVRSVPSVLHNHHNGVAAAHTTLQQQPGVSHHHTQLSNASNNTHVHHSQADDLQFHDIATLNQHHYRHSDLARYQPLPASQILFPPTSTNTSASPSSFTKHTSPAHKSTKLEPKTTCSNSTNGNICEDEYHITSSSSIPEDTFYLDRSELWKLNDLNYNRSICAALQYLKTSLGHGYKLLLFGDGVGVAALQALQLGAAEVTTLANSHSHEELLHCVAANNDINSSRLKFIASEDIETLEGDYEALLVELIDEGGCLHQRVLEDVALARATCLESNALIMPGRVTVQAMLIESYALRQDSMVTSDDNTLGYLIAGFMNDFQMTTHCGIDLSVLEHEPLSQPFELLTFDLNEFNVGEVPSYLDLSNNITVTAVETGTIHAILYWFDLDLTPDVKVSSLDTKSHWKQAAILQKIPITVSRGSTLRVKSMCRNNCIHASLSLAYD